MESRIETGVPLVRSLCFGVNIRKHERHVNFSEREHFTVLRMYMIRDRNAQSMRRAFGRLCGATQCLTPPLRRDQEKFCVLMPCNWTESDMKTNVSGNVPRALTFGKERIENVSRASSEAWIFSGQVAK